MRDDRHSFHLISPCQKASTLSNLPPVRRPLLCSDDLGDPTNIESRGIDTAYPPSTFNQENLGIALLSQLRSILSALLNY